LVGDLEPYGGTTDYILTECFDYYGLAGNPIYINESFVQTDLSNIVLSEDHNQSNLLWRYVHEMSHTFDGIDSLQIQGNWNFDKEFFATLKTVYALSEFGYGMEADGNSGETIYEYFAEFDTLKNGVYSSEGLTYTLLSYLYEYDEHPWYHLHNVFLNMNDLGRDLQSDEEKFSEFITALENELNVKLSDVLTEKEWNGLCGKFNLANR
jgi:hypothetical protein